MDKTPATHVWAVVVIVQGGDALLEAISGLFTQIAKEPPLPQPSLGFSGIQQIKDEAAIEHLREGQAMQAAAGEAEVEAELEQQISETLGEIADLRRSTT